MMNGVQQQTPQDAAVPKVQTTAAANGNATATPTTPAAAAVNKKRKKDGLKPIITTENPQPGCVFLPYPSSLCRSLLAFPYPSGPYPWLLPGCYEDAQLRCAILQQASAQMFHWRGSVRCCTAAEGGTGAMGGRGT